MIQQRETTLNVLQRAPHQNGQGEPGPATESPAPQAPGSSTAGPSAADSSLSTARPLAEPAAAAPAVADPQRQTTDPRQLQAESPVQIAARLRQEDTGDAAEPTRRRGRHVREEQESESQQIDQDLLRLAALPVTDPQYQQLRRAVIETHLPLVHHLAQRFRGRGEPYDDLVQVGTIGLLHAVDRFDPHRGTFATFAVPTIVGEIRRHFRDRGWAMRIPRRIQDLGRRVSEARETLTHTLDRSPTVQELSEHLGVDQDLVIEALDTASAYITVPLPTTAEESDRMGKAFEDAGLELVEQRETLRPLLARLPAREQRILELRFAKGLSQSQIAAEVGVSQMHVSRLLTKSLNILRSGLTQEL